ncbi:glycosyltransferase, partial [bacterium]|nr:glycosyltransferase [Candidatus Elulimicrobium humile]
IPIEILSNLQEKNIHLRYRKNESGDFGHQSINQCLDEIEDGFIYVLDDDNILHENFYQSIYNYIKENPNKSGFIFNQKVGGKDFSGLDVRLVKEENIKVGHIDMAQFLLKRSLIGHTRFNPMKYVADGEFIVEVFESNKEDFLFIDEVLCYYNFIEKKKINSLPRVLLVGTDENVELKSRFFVDYESTEINTKTIKTDEKIDEVIKEFNPDSIITVGESFGNFPKLSYHSLDVRSRWLHFNQLSDDIGDAAYRCASNYILSDFDSNTPLVSFFTPIYNTGEKLFRTYESVKSQDYKNWEWVLVNDSSDNGRTLRIAEEISRLDCRVKVYDFRKKSNGIIGESKYRAASLCSGKWIMELDHDDCLTYDAASMMVDTFKMYPDAKFVYSDCTEINENHESLTYGEGFCFGYGSYRDETYNGRVYKVANASNINPKTIRHIVGVPNHFRAWEKSFYHSIGGHNRRLTIADDYELIVRTFLNTRMVRIPKMLYLQFYHNSNTQDITRKDIQRRVKTIREFYDRKIKQRFNDLGLVDWAWDENQLNPLMTESRFGSREGYANYIMNSDNKVEYYGLNSTDPVLIL